jgi:uncharacterized protein
MLRALAIAALVAGAPATLPAPGRWVTDQTGQVAAADRQALDRELEAFEQSSGHQVVVFVGHTTGGEPIEDWAVRTFEAWKVGRAKLDDGVALFVMLDDHTARIEVGYGLEDKLTDVQSSRILREVLIPRMRAGDVTGAVTGATRAIVTQLGGSGAQPAPQGVVLPDRAKMIAMAVIGGLFLVLLIAKPRAALFLLMLLSGRRRDGRRGGGFGGGGGFMGGGGRSGGGGATGRW